VTCRNPEERRSVLHRALSSAIDQATMINHSLYLSQSLTSSLSDIVSWTYPHSSINLRPARYPLRPPSLPSKREMRRSSPKIHPYLPSKSDLQRYPTPNPRPNPNSNPNPSANPNPNPNPSSYPPPRRNHQRRPRRNPQLLPIQSPVPGLLLTRSSCSISYRVQERVSRISKGL
jgi:hypothetical protein